VCSYYHFGDNLGLIFILLLILWSSQYLDKSVCDAM